MWLTRVPGGREKRAAEHYRISLPVLLDSRGNNGIQINARTANDWDIVKLSQNTG